MLDDTKTGTVAGTGAAINVLCGFKPRMVKVWNEAAGGLNHLEWTDSMAAAKGFKTITDGTISYIASGGISQYAGSAAANSEGFTLGADTDINVSGETLHWIAIR